VSERWHALVCLVQNTVYACIRFSLCLSVRPSPLTHTLTLTHSLTHSLCQADAPLAADGRGDWLGEATAEHFTPGMGNHDAVVNTETAPGSPATHMNTGTGCLCLCLSECVSVCLCVSVSVYLCVCVLCPRVSTVRRWRAGAHQAAAPPSDPSSLAASGCLRGPVPTAHASLSGWPPRLAHDMSCTRSTRLFKSSIAHNTHRQTHI
jgi:hypothetical protein